MNMTEQHDSRFEPFEQNMTVDLFKKWQSICYSFFWSCNLNFIDVAPYNNQKIKKQNLKKLCRQYTNIL